MPCEITMHRDSIWILGIRTIYQVRAIICSRLDCTSICSKQEYRCGLTPPYYSSCYPWYECSPTLIALPMTLWPTRMRPKNWHHFSIKMNCLSYRNPRCWFGHQFRGLEPGVIGVDLGLGPIDARAGDGVRISHFDELIVIIYLNNFIIKEILRWFTLCTVVRIALSYSCEIWA